jgi:hypothetical protein
MQQKNRLQVLDYLMEGRLQEKNQRLSCRAFSREYEPGCARLLSDLQDLGSRSLSCRTAGSLLDFNLTLWMSRLDVKILTFRHFNRYLSCLSRGEDTSCQWKQHGILKNQRACDTCEPIPRLRFRKRRPLLCLASHSRASGSPDHQSHRATELRNGAPAQGGQDQLASAEPQDSPNLAAEEIATFLHRRCALVLPRRKYRKTVSRDRRSSSVSRRLSSPAAPLSALMNISIRRWQSDIKPIGSEQLLDFAPI